MFSNPPIYSLSNLKTDESPAFVTAYGFIFAYLYNLVPDCGPWPCPPGAIWSNYYVLCIASYAWSTINHNIFGCIILLEIYGVWSLFLRFYLGLLFSYA